MLIAIVEDREAAGIVISHDGVHSTARGLFYTLYGRRGV